MTSLSARAAGAAQRPDPAAGPPPQEWIHSASHRQRLEFAFALLRHQGILALPAVDAEGGPERDLLEAALGTRIPGPLRPSVAWSTADDEACFAADGRLRTDLPLHNDGVLVAVLTLALAAVGLIGRPDVATGRYLVLHAVPF